MNTGDWNAEVLHGTALAGGVIQGVVSASTSARAISSTSVPVLWVQLQNLGTAAVYFGSSTVTATGSTRGPRMLSNGETIKLPINNLNALFIIVAAATQDVAYIAGISGSVP